MFNLVCFYKCLFILNTDMVMSYALVVWLNTKRKQYSILPSKCIIEPATLSVEDLPMEGEEG